MGSEGWPGRFGGEAGEGLVSSVEVGDDLGSEEVFGGDVEAVGVALDRLEQPGRRVVEFAQQGGGGGRARRRGRGSAAGFRSGLGVRRRRVG